MENFIVIETSTDHGTIAKVEDGRLVDVVEFRCGRSHSAGIFQPLGRLLAESTPELIVAGTGPGNYSGIRVGIAAGLGISMARGVPMIGLPSVCALGPAFGLERYAITGDARRGSWWYAEVENGTLSLPPVVGDEAEILGRLQQWPGQVFTLDAASPPFCQAQPVTPRADVLAGRVANLSGAEIQRLAGLETEPLYLRAPFITVSRKKGGLPGPGAEPAS